MKNKRILALLAALSLAGSALSEPVDTELVVEMTSEQKLRLEQRLSELTGKPVLSSPVLGVKGLKKFLGL